MVPGGGVDPGGAVVACAACGRWRGSLADSFVAACEACVQLRARLRQEVWAAELGGTAVSLAGELGGAGPS